MSAHLQVERIRRPGEQRPPKDLNLARAFHVAACAVLGWEPEAHGARAEVARMVGESPTNYGRRVSGRVGISQPVLAKWLSAFTRVTSVELVVTIGVRSPTRRSV